MTADIGMKLRLIPAGEFLTGSPESEEGGDDEQQHPAQITKPFYLQTTEVTQGQWKSVMDTEPWSDKKFVKKGTNYPATYVTWDDAQEFCRRLSEIERVTYRLPREAEWEYACRAGTTTVYYFGDDGSLLGDYAWSASNASNSGGKHAHEVGQKTPNAFGLYDTLGNVSEWCQDGHEVYYARDLVRVFRGGGWGDDAEACRAAEQVKVDPQLRSGDLGFRVAADPSAFSSKIEANASESGSR
jgi:formylglycine-generating enzyme required for sulfatase activity